MAKNGGGVRWGKNVGWGDREGRGQKIEQREGEEGGYMAGKGRER